MAEFHNPFRRDRPKAEPVAAPTEDPVLEEAIAQKSLFKRALPVFACGAGLFSDGYINNVIGSVTTVFGRKYGDLYTGTTAAQNVAAIAFAGTVVGQLIFGFLSDHWSRTNSLVISTIILIVFTALASGSYYHGSIIGMFNILTAWRFFVGIGIGGEYPAGSVGCAESTGELKKGTRHRWFILFTNTMIDWGFVFGAFIPYVVAAACHNRHLSTIWRVSLGIGVAFPLVLLVLRFRLKEPEGFARNSMKRKTPYSLVLKYYWWRLLCVSIIWFLYDFSTYAFGIYSSPILEGIYGGGDGVPLTTIFGWNTVINLFYIPGTIIGAFVSDWLGPKYTLVLGVLLQSVVGFVMAGVYSQISKHIAAFAVVYGIFLSLGELGPGNNIGLLAAKTCATGIRGRFYGLAAAFGKIGAFVGTYVFPLIQDAGGDDTVKRNQYPFFVAGSLCILSAAIALFGLPNVGQDTIAYEDIAFREYLERNGWDTNQLGIAPREDSEEAKVVSKEVAHSEQ
ncbi:sugar transporter domain-containing protein [Sarocladium implicatum]|nr:sugar transporter domain-containing protein [Sarocladium implicatum]